jgi:hypothetical protein
MDTSDRLASTVSALENKPLAGQVFEALLDWAVVMLGATE